MAKLTQFTGVRNDRYWHYSDPTHRMHLKWYELVPGTRSLWACVREDWANGYTQWVAIAHVSVETHIVELPRGDGSQARELVALAGSSISWCRQSVSWR